MLGHVADQRDVARDAMASVVGVDDHSFVEYQKFTYVINNTDTYNANNDNTISSGLILIYHCRNADESEKKAKQFSIIKRTPTPTAMHSPLIESAKFENDENSEFDNDHVGIDIREETVISKNEAKKNSRKQRAREFSPNLRTTSNSEELAANKPKFGDAILTKENDEEVQDARYEINLL